MISELEYDCQGLKYYGGQGVEGQDEVGIYEVNHARDEVPNEDVLKKFKNLNKAIEFYNSLDIPKSLWSVNPIPELLICHGEK